MDYYDEVLGKIRYHVSKLKREDLQDIPALVKQLFDDVKREEIKINPTPILEQHLSSYTNLPNHVIPCNIPEKGKVEVYSFKFKIEKGDVFLNELISKIDYVEDSFYHKRVKFSVFSEHLCFTYINWGSKGKEEVKKLAAEFFNKATYNILSIQNLLNDYSQFEKNVRQFAVNRMRELN